MIKAWRARDELPVCSPMFALDPDAAPAFDTGILFCHVMIDGMPIRAGITMDAFEHLSARAGLGAEQDFGGAVDADLLSLLKPVIEAHLEAKHFHQGGEDPLIIGIDDLVVH